MKKTLIEMEIKQEEIEDMLRHKLSELDEVQSKYARVNENMAISQVEMQTMRKVYETDVQKLQEKLGEI